MLAQDSKTNYSVQDSGYQDAPRPPACATGRPLPPWTTTPRLFVGRAGAVVERHTEQPGKHQPAKPAPQGRQTADTAATAALNPLICSISISSSLTCPAVFPLIFPQDPWRARGFPVVGLVDNADISLACPRWRPTWATLLPSLPGRAPGTPPRPRGGPMSLVSPCRFQSGCAGRHAQCQSRALSEQAHQGGGVWPGGRLKIASR